MNGSALQPAWHEPSARWCQWYAVSFRSDFCHASYTAQHDSLAPPSIHLRHHLRPSEFPDSGAATNAAVSSLVVHSDPASSSDRPTPLIFIPTLHPHLHLSPPPRPPPPPSLLYLTSSLTLPPSFCPPPLPHVPSLATASRRALCMCSAPSSSSSSSVFVLPSRLFTFTTQLLTSRTFVWKPLLGFPHSCHHTDYATFIEG